jgi:methyl-accepting chemotaxis protein
VSIAGQITEISDAVREVNEVIEALGKNAESVNQNIHQHVDANERIEQVMSIVRAVSETGISVR